MVNLRSASILLSATLIGLVSGQDDMATTTVDGPTDVNQEYEALGVDGSGTTNPSKCFWHIMAKFNEQIKLPVRMSYRAVGSGTGIKEFLGKDIKIDGEETDTYEAYNDFGAGDIPISKEDRQEWNDKGIDFVQLPFVLSAVVSCCKLVCVVYIVHILCSYLISCCDLTCHSLRHFSIAFLEYPVVNVD